MLKKLLKKLCLVLVLLSSLSLSVIGCSKQVENLEVSPENTPITSSDSYESFGLGEIPDIQVQFGRDGQPFIMHFEDNETALEIARNVGDEGKNLPIYNYDNFENYEVMQYYDIPSSYTIPSEPETVTQQRAGEVYYSAPNRIIFFYQDANIEGEDTKIGTFENANELKSAVEDNPVQEGWGNKLIIIQYVD